MLQNPGDGVVQPAPPELSPDDAVRIAAEVFGIAARARALGSHQDRNFRLTRSGDGDELLLKVANPSTTAAELEAQSRAADRIAAFAPDVRVPRARVLGDDADAGARTVAAVEHGGITMHARVLEFLDGGTLSGSGYLSPAVVRAIGRLAATVDLALDGFDAPGVDRPNQWDLRRSPEVLAELLPFIADERLRARVRSSAEAAWSTVAEHAADLPVQPIHGDLTDDNVVWGDPIRRLPDGVIDLGDLNLGWTVGELAITVSSLLHHDGMSLPAALRAVTAYHALRPLGLDELDALWPLVVVRAAVLVASAHHVLETDPGNAYAAENLEHEVAILDAATSVPPPVATALVRAAAGAPVEPATAPVPARLVPGLDPHLIAVLDLGTGSPDLHDGRWLEPGIEGRLAEAAIARGARAAMTRFGERRLTRSAPAGADEPANTALGVEVLLGAPSEVAAPWAATVEASDGGLVLRGAGFALFLDGVEPLLPDDPDRDDVARTAVRVGAGERIGRAASVIGIRVVREDADARAVTAPAFVAASLAEAWRTVVADPTPLLLGRALPDDRVDAAEVLARRTSVFAEVQEHYYDEPPAIERGWREYLVDTDARVYLDSVNNVTSVGHSHPRLAEAVADQWRRLNTNSRFSYDALGTFAERLAQTLPDGLDEVFLVNSGSEAVDLALRLARAWSGRRDVVAVREAYHGWTDLSDAVTTSIADNPGALGTRPDWVHVIDAPNAYRGRHRGAAAGRYADDAVAELDRLAASGTPAGAFIAETILGNAGGVVLPGGYLEAVYRAVRAHGGLAVADEVQVGYGRLGDWFWGFEQQGVVPDLVTVAKAMGNGHPLGAVITTREVAERFRTEGSFFSSAGGSPVSCVVGTTVLDILRDEGLPRNARDVGARFRRLVEELATRHPLIGTVHGSGLYLGIELVRDRETLEPADVETAAICERLRELGVIVQPTSERGNVLKVKPPLCFTDADADTFVAALDRVLTTGW